MAYDDSVLSGRTHLVLAALATIALIVAAALGAGHAALALCPALLVALPLLLGRFPGEHTIDRLAARRRRPAPAPSPRRLLPRAPRSIVRRPRLLATLSASRAPPVLVRT